MINEEIIAKLVGVLTFNVDTNGLQRFNGMMRSVERQMNQLGKSADALGKKLSAKMGIKVDSAGQEKLAKTVRANLDRELKLEQAVQRTRRATFTAELQGQKLINLRQKESAATQSLALRDKIAQAVLDAKSAKAEGERLKLQGLALKQAQSLEQHKARQARWEALLGQQQKKTAILQQKQFQAMTATQRAEFALQQSRLNAHRAGVKFAASQEAARLRAQRLDVSHAQKAERFEWAKTRQSVWAAKQAESKPSTFMGLGTGALALGGVTAGLAAIVGAVSALSDRLAATQARVSESQQLENVLSQAGGKNPANAEFAKSEWLRINAKYGTEASLESAKAYRTFLMAEMARGRSISQATGTYETRQAAFRGAGMTAEEQRRANLQLQQLASKTVADKEDLNTFSEAAPLLVEPIRRAWAERNKHPLDANLEKDFRASTKTGNLKAIDFTKGIELFVKENAAAIERQSGSIDANATRLANQQFLQQQGLDQTPGLINSINDRIKSEMELTEAMKPLKEAAVQADIALNKLAASFFRLTFGKSDTPEQSAKKVDLFSPDQPAIDPSALSSPQPSSGEKVVDPIDKLWKWMFNIPDYSEGAAKDLKVDAPKGAFSFDDLSLKLGQIASQFETVPDESNQREFHVPQLLSAKQAIARATSVPSAHFPDDVNSYRVQPQDSSSSAKGATNIVNNTIEPTTVNITVTPPPGMDTEQVANLVSEKFHDEMGRLLREASVNQQEVQ